MENKIPSHVIFFAFLIATILCVLLWKVVFGQNTYWLAWVSVGDYLLEQGTPVEKAPTIVVTTLEKPPVTPKPIEKVKVPVKEVKAPVEPKIDNYDIDRLARAVAMAETGNCTKWYGKTYNNCFGIKNGRTAPCPKVGKSKMCIYEKPEDSYKAFKTIWAKWYAWKPNLKMAQRWTWHDNAVRWLSHVNLYYNKG